MYVTNCSDYVQVYKTSGEYVTSFGRKGKGPGMFDRPLGIAVDDCGVVYVCDNGNDRVQIF